MLLEMYYSNSIIENVQFILFCCIKRKNKVIIEIFFSYTPGICTAGIPCLILYLLPPGLSKYVIILKLDNLQNHSSVYLENLYKSARCSGEWFGVSCLYLSIQVGIDVVELRRHVEPLFLHVNWRTLHKRSEPTYFNYILLAKHLTLQFLYQEMNIER